MDPSGCFAEAILLPAPKKRVKKLISSDSYLLVKLIVCETDLNKTGFFVAQNKFR